LCLTTRKWKISYVRFVSAKNTNYVGQAHSKWMENKSCVGQFNAWQTPRESERKKKIVFVGPTQHWSRIFLNNALAWPTIYD